MPRAEGLQEYFNKVNELASKTNEIVLLGSAYYFDQGRLYTLNDEIASEREEWWFVFHGALLEQYNYMTRPQKGFPRLEGYLDRLRPDALVKSEVVEPYRGHVVHWDLDNKRAIFDKFLTCDIASGTHTRTVNWWLEPVEGVK